MTSPVHDLFEATSIEAMTHRDENFRRRDRHALCAVQRTFSLRKRLPHYSRLVHPMTSHDFALGYSSLYLIKTVINSDAHRRILQACIPQAITIIAQKLPSNLLWSILACSSMVSKSMPLEQTRSDVAIKSLRHLLRCK